MILVREARESIEGVHTMPAAPAPMIAIFFLAGLPDIVRRAWLTRTSEINGSYYQSV